MGRRARRGRGRPAASAGRLGFPLLVRPSYVLGGRAMRIAYDEDALEAVLERGHRRLPGPPDPHRPVSRGRLRARRRRARRRRARRRRGRHAAHRGGGHPLGRFVRRPAALPARAARGARRDPPGHREARAGARGRGPHERPVRDPRRRALRPRGEPARLAHGPVRREVDGRAVRAPRRAPLPRRDASGASASPRSRPSSASRSRRPCFRSGASKASTRSSAPRCARRARSWAATGASASRS